MTALATEIDKKKQPKLEKRNREKNNCMDISSDKLARLK